MIRKLTRRQVVAAVTAPVALAQAPPVAKPPADELQAAKDRVRQDGEKLTQFKLPMSAEPAFHFNP